MGSLLIGYHTYPPKIILQLAMYNRRREEGLLSFLYLCKSYMIISKLPLLKKIQKDIGGEKKKTGGR